MSEMTALSKRHHQAPKLNLKMEHQNMIAETVNETVKSKYQQSEAPQKLLPAFRQEPPEAKP